MSPSFLVNTQAHALTRALPQYQIFTEINRINTKFIINSNFRQTNRNNVFVLKSPIHNKNNRFAQKLSAKTDDAMNASVAIESRTLCVYKMFEFS